jgi:palmitoyltransferase
MNKILSKEKSIISPSGNYNDNSLSIEEKLFNYIEKSDIENIKNILFLPNLKFWEFLDSEDSTVLIKLSYSDLNVIFDLIQLAKENLNEKQLRIYINKKAQNGFTALHYASFRGNVRLCEKLIENFADVDIINNNGLNVIHMAAQGNNPATLVLFKEKYKLNIETYDNVNSSPMHWAVYMGSEIAIDYLASWNVSINKKDKDGFTPLHLAVMTGNIILIQKHSILSK